MATNINILPGWHLISFPQTPCLSHRCDASSENVHFRSSSLFKLWDRYPWSHLKFIVPSSSNLFSVVLNLPLLILGTLQLLTHVPEREFRKYNWLTKTVDFLSINIRLTIKTRGMLFTIRFINTAMKTVRNLCVSFREKHWSISLWVQDAFNLQFLCWLGRLGVKHSTLLTFQGYIFSQVAFLKKVVRNIFNSHF